MADVGLGGLHTLSDSAPVACPFWRHRLVTSHMSGFRSRSGSGSGFKVIGIGHYEPPGIFVFNGHSHHHDGVVTYDINSWGNGSKAVVFKLRGHDGRKDTICRIYIVIQGGDISFLLPIYSVLPIPGARCHHGMMCVFPYL